MLVLQITVRPQYIRIQCSVVTSVILKSWGYCSSDFFFTGPINVFQTQNNYSFCTPLVWIPSAYLQAIGSELSLLLGGKIEATDIKGSAQHWLRPWVFYKAGLEVCKWKSGHSGMEKNLWKLPFANCKVKYMCMHIQFWF